MDRTCPGLSELIGQQLFLSGDHTGAGQCSICFEQITLEKAWVLACGHTYHRACILRGWSRDPRCALCRRTIRDIDLPPSPEQQAAQRAAEAEERAAAQLAEVRRREDRSNMSAWSRDLRPVVGDAVVITASRPDYIQMDLIRDGPDNTFSSASRIGRVLQLLASAARPGTTSYRVEFENTPGVIIESDQLRKLDNDDELAQESEGELKYVGDGGAPPAPGAVDLRVHGPDEEGGDWVEYTYPMLTLWALDVTESTAGGGDPAPPSMWRDSDSPTF
jgi:hypothetical protein